MDKIEVLLKIIKESEYIVFFGGAGVSVASGIPDFRSENGIYSKSPEYYLSDEYLKNYPLEFSKFYKKSLVFPKAKPNKAHEFLAKLEKEGKLKAIITQNVDDLHQKAGSKNVIHLHGNWNINYCMKCFRNFTLSEFLKSSDISYCPCGGVIRPDITLYGEMLNETSTLNAIKHIEKADTLIIGGTSLTVYPAASYINYFKGKNLILINKDKNIENFANLVITKNIEDVFFKIGEKLWT